MFEIMEKGGFLMYPILALSVVSLAIFMERLFALRGSKFVPAQLIVTLKAAIMRKDYSEAEQICAATDTAIGRIMREVILHRNEDWQHMTAIVETAGRREADRLAKYQEALSTIVALSPLMGLLGTVFGMIRLFSVLSDGGVGDPHALSGGIAIALLTTAAGLCVAIPAQIFYYIVKAKSDTMISLLEKEVSELSAIVKPEA